jgi:hypothetical protein
MLGYFVFGSNALHIVIGMSIATLVILFGVFESPKGWISIEKNKLNIYGVKERIDTRQLREVILKNDKISLINIYGESVNSYNLKLNPTVSYNIKKFLEEKLQGNAIEVIDQVIELD